MKSELDKVDDAYLDVVRRILQSLGRRSHRGGEPGDSWEEFLAATDGSVAAAPIERGEQGDFEVREPLL